MESSGPAQQDPRPSADTPGGEPRAGTGLRVLAALLGLVLAFACAVMVVVMVEIGQNPRCDDPAAIAEEAAETGATEVECFDGSASQKLIALVLGWPSGILAGVAALLALLFALTGRRGTLLVRVTAAAVALGALSILIGSI